MQSGVKKSVLVAVMVAAQFVRVTCAAAAGWILTERVRPAVPDHAKSDRIYGVYGFMAV